VCAPARDLGEPVVEQRREHLTIDFGRGNGTRAQLRHHDPAPLAERSLEARLAMLRLVVVSPACRARRHDRADVTRG